MKALRQVGLRRAARFGFTSLAMLPYRLMLFPPLRSAWLRMLGARIGRGTILHDLRFFNLDRVGLRGLAMGEDCFVGDECLLDLAEAIRLGPQVTLAERVLILTHTNVGLADHPLQRFFPGMAAPVTVERGAFIGAAVTILPGITIGQESFVAAGSVVTADVPPRHLVAGVPARPVRRIE